MMRVWGKVTRSGSKAVYPRAYYEPYIKFMIWMPFKKGHQSYIQVQWRNWTFEPKPGQLIMATGFFDMVEWNGTRYPTLYCNGTGHGADDPNPIQPGVEPVDRIPSWKDYPQYGKQSALNRLSTSEEEGSDEE